MNEPIGRQTGQTDTLTCTTRVTLTQQQKSYKILHPIRHILNFNNKTSSRANEEF